MSSSRGFWTRKRLNVSKGGCFGAFVVVWEVVVGVAVVACLLCSSSSLSCWAAGWLWHWVPGVWDVVVRLGCWRTLCISPVIAMQVSGIASPTLSCIQNQHLSFKPNALKSAQAKMLCWVCLCSRHTPQAPGQLRLLPSSTHKHKVWQSSHLHLVCKYLHPSLIHQQPGICPGRT